MTDIVDQIDQLVDNQLAGGEPRIGFNFGDPQFPDCPHCDRKWHGIAITVRVAEMYDLGHYDNDYRVDTDESPVLCHGSDFIGPMPSGTERRNFLTFRGSLLNEFIRTFQLDLTPYNYALGIQEGASWVIPEGFTEIGTLEE